jgi:Tol biopolymer transport system component
LSPDGKWALATVPGPPPKVMAYPTGAGEPRKINMGSMVSTASARWFPDSTRVLLCGHESGKASRCYVQDGREGAPRPLTREDTDDAVISPDGRAVLARTRSGGRVANGGGSFDLYPVDGATPRKVMDLSPDDVVSLIRWEPTGRSVLISSGSLPARVERVFIENGRREPVLTIAPATMVGTLGVSNVIMAADPRVYAYCLNQHLSRLFLVQGAR